MTHEKCKPGSYDGDVTLYIGRPVKPVSVDPCIEDLVLALNARGLSTIASCCGHGRRPGSIVLADGRELHVTYSRREGDALRSLFPLDIHGHLVDAPERPR
jgi:hypothetical protein